MSMCVDVGNQLGKGFLIVEEGQNVNEIDAFLGEVGIMVDNVKIVHSLQ